MNKKQISMNKPCPCGSGKKYKKCCYIKDTNSISLSRINREIEIPEYCNIDYNEPILDSHFLNFNKLNERSAQRLLYSGLLMPEIEELATKVSSSFISRSKAEAKKIESTEDVIKLVEIMAQNPDSINQIKLIKKLVNKKELSIPIIFKKLELSQDDAFVEIAIRIIHRSGKDYSSQIIDIITMHQRNAYSVSQLCMLLGFYDNQESLKVLWDYFHFFKEYFPNTNYSDGPLLGILEIKDREKERFLSRIQNMSNLTK